MSSKPQTVQDLIDNLQKLVKIKPECKDFPIIYSTDDEGNEYSKIYYIPNFTQVGDLEERYLEVIGHYSKDNDYIALEDCNCVIIN
jgi:hypothetical protein